jgi:hypothetical protein
MSRLIELLVSGPSDPLTLAGLVLAVWLPLCAVLLALLWALAQVQWYFMRRRPRRPAVIVPPSELRPLAARRYVTDGPRSGAVLNTARVTAVVAAVAGVTAFLLATNIGTLMAVLGRGG